jgi:uncharacterized protein YjiS (DUF1127 family)
MDHYQTDNEHSFHLCKWESHIVVEHRSWIMTHPIRDLLDTLIREYRIWKAMRAVGTLDDGVLHDIGIDRGSIEGAVRRGRR